MTSSSEFRNINITVGNVSIAITTDQPVFGQNDSDNSWETATDNGSVFSTFSHTSSAFSEAEAEAYPPFRGSTNVFPAQQPVSAFPAFGPAVPAQQPVSAFPAFGQHDQDLLDRDHQIQDLEQRLRFAREEISDQRRRVPTCGDSGGQRLDGYSCTAYVYLNRNGRCRHHS